MSYPSYTQPRLVVLVGPTSSGKSELAVKLAKKFQGEIVNADSRQIYKGMDLGTGKVDGKWHKNSGRYFYAYKGIRHHLIDFISPKRQYSAALFQRDAKKAIADVARRGKLPILSGGTGHWIDAVVFNLPIPEIKPNFKLRAKLEKKSAADLFRQLKKLDPARAKTIDSQNKRRLIRALEIIISTGKPVPIFKSLNLKSLNYQVLWLGIKTDQSTLYKKIDKRLKQRIKLGMLNEVAKLHKQGLSWQKLENFGLEYKYISLYLQKKLAYDDMVNQLAYAIKHYSKRQLTWWKKNKQIAWIKTPNQAIKRVEKFLKS